MTLDWDNSPVYNDFKNSAVLGSEPLAAKKAQGQLLGKPKGTLQKSKFDQDVGKIKELMGYGLSVRKIAKVLGYSSHIALNTYINKRSLHQTVIAARVPVAGVTG
jgi:hypothetical protein